MAAKAATQIFSANLDRCYLCNRPFRTFETFYVVRVWADGQESHYGDKRGKCHQCRERTLPPATVPLDRNWLARLK